MADAAVEFLLQNLQQLLVYHYQLISNAKEQVEQLNKDLSLFKAFLRDSVKVRRKDETLKEIVGQIRNVVYDAEDIIDAFVTKAAAAAQSKSKINFLKNAIQVPADLLDVAKKVESIGKEVKAIYGDKSKFDLANQLKEGDGSSKAQAPPRSEDDVVGFEDEATTLIGYITENTEELDVISIIGMPGLGKTTLAGVIFRDTRITYEFPIRIWVYLSSEPKRKDVFLAILRQLKTNLSDDMYRSSEDELAQLVTAELERGKFLIVMDDVWTDADWDQVKIALPKNTNMGKVLITSRQVEVGRYANPKRDPHELRFLTFEESCSLLCLKALRESKFPQDLELYGKQIAKQCKGLPLAIVVIGGILAKKRNAWEKVSKRVNTYLNEDPERRMDKIISLSYDKLPYHLKACFLYLALFPEDYEIPVWKLIRMWIAEGLIQEKDDISLEETAENYVEDLINRNLVRIGKMTSDGRVKTCLIHDKIRDFCKIEAGTERENFLQEIKKNDEGVFHPPVENVQIFRRLCIHSYIGEFLSLKPNGPRVRSFACFSKDKPSSSGNEVSISTIAATFKLLRVLDVEPIRFSKLSSDLFQLIHLRYIHLSFKLDKLPTAFFKLWNIQTLIVDTTSSTLEIKADIWEMINLRHFKTKASATLPKPEKKSKGCDKLQTLGTISPKSCTEDVFHGARNLKKLGIRGRLASLLEGKNTGSFDNFIKLGNLEKLKLINDTSSEGKLDGLPPPYKFPTKLRSLTLSGTFLDWSHMNILGMLERLRVLKLKEKAFVGPCWVTADRSFQSLEVLHIERTTLEFWKVSGHDHFPKLKSVELHNCDELQEIPIQLADIQSLQLLDLHNTKNATRSAKEICNAKNEKKCPSFKLIVFPPQE